MKSNKEKQDFAVNLLRKGISYNIVNDKLKSKYGTGMSNSTLKKLRNYAYSEPTNKDKIIELEQELKLFKRLYFELLEKDKKTTGK
jgi:hypothetical protein